MKWKKFTLTTTTEAVDLISCAFDEIGIEGIEIEDNIPSYGKKRQKGCSSIYSRSCLPTKE